MIKTTFSPRKQKTFFCRTKIVIIFRILTNRGEYVASFVSFFVWCKLGRPGPPGRPPEVGPGVAGPLPPPLLAEPPPAAIAPSWLHKKFL